MTRDGDGVELRDASGAAVAQLGHGPGGEVATAEGRWHVGVERQGHGWVIVFRDPSTEEPAACAYPRGVLSAYDLWLAPEDTYRLRENPISNVWTLRRDRTKLVRISGTAPERSVLVLDAVVPDARLGLAIVLAYETIRYDDSIPHLQGGGGGGGG
jgi:hypothetical protein